MKTTKILVVVSALVAFGVGCLGSTKSLCEYADGKACQDLDAGLDGSVPDGTIPEAGPDAEPPPKDCLTPTDPTKNPEKCLVDAFGAFVSVTGDDGNDGSKAKPFKTLGRALQGVRTRIVVCEGEYTGSVDVTRAVEVYGGVSCDFTKAGAKAKVVATKPAYGIKVEKVTGAVVLADLDVVGMNAAAPSESSVGVFVTESGNVKLLRSRVEAGDGADAPAARDGSYSYPADALLKGANADDKGTGSFSDDTPGAGGASGTCPGGGTTAGGIGGVPGGQGNDATPATPALLSLPLPRIWPPAHGGGMISRVSTLVRFARACALGGAVSALAGAACAKNDGAQGLGPSTDAGAPDGTSRADAVPEKRAFCTYSVPPFEIDRGVRGETGVTLVPIVRGHEESSIADGGIVADGGALPSLRASVAVGYAKGFGAPRAVELGADGVVSPRNVPSRLESLERRPERGAKRAVLRVVPRAVRGADILVSVDTVELGPDKTRHVFCGAAEGTPYVAFDGPSLLLGAEGESETIACRTVLRGREHRALESQVTLGGSRLEAQLVLEGRVLGAREVTLKAQEKPSERYAFTDLGFVSDGDRGLVTARYDGGVVEALVRGSEPSVVRPSPLGREAWTFATSATPEGFVTWATTAQKPGLFRALASAPGAARPAADAAEITAIEGLESAGDERTFVSASTSGARTWVTFVERADGRRRGVLVGVDGDRARGSFVFGAGEADLLEARAIELRTGVVALVYLTSQGTSEATLTGAVVTCPDAR